MTNLVSIVTPVAPYHAHLLPRCEASVKAQTVEATHIIVHDGESRGAGWARNQGLAYVSSPFVCFLDCDDVLDPTFLEECFDAYDERHYIYTDWVQGQKVKAAPDCAWKGQAWHCITTLLPTEWARQVGGFDETLPAGEDTHFYMKLTRAGMCGKHLALPLFYYSKDGQRSQNFKDSAAYHGLMKRLTAEFGGKVMGCCGDSPQVSNQPVNEQLPGMVLAQAVWHGNRQVHGVKSGYLYPRTGNGKQIWVYPEDAHAAPALFQIIRPTPPAVPPAPPKPPVLPKLPPREPELPTLNGAPEVAAYIMENSADPEKQPQALPVESAVASEVSPDVERVIRKARRGKGRG